MNKKLISALDQLTEIFKNDSRCLGGWEFGSVARGLSDEYSDVDPVFVIDGNFFEEFDKDLYSMFEQICDEIIIYWHETFNNDEIKNYGIEILIQEEILQFDIFLLNSLKQDSWWFELHSTDVDFKDIIFDRGSEISKIVKHAPKGTLCKYDTIYAIETYWHHTHMIIKYFKRKDYFKLLKTIEILMRSHVYLLLSEYDQTTWGGWESKIKFIPQEKQNHLMNYYASNDFDIIAKNIMESIIFFSLDAKEICRDQTLTYPLKMEEKIMSEWKKQMGF